MININNDGGILSDFVPQSDLREWSYMDSKRFETPLAVGANLVFALPAGQNRRQSPIYKTRQTLRGFR